MPIEDGEYVKRTEDGVRFAIESELQDEFGQNIDLTDSSVFSTLAEVVSAVINSNQEESLKRVYQSSFLETATGIDLERVVAIIGLQRRSAINATGVQRFFADGKVRQDYPIQRGTRVQTDSDQPVAFETTEVQTLELIDSFEDGDISEYSGDTGNGTVLTNDSDAVDGDNVVELDATDGAHIYRDDIQIGQGTTLHCHTVPTASTEPTITFGIDTSDSTNHFQLRFDVANDDVVLERVDSGTVASTLGTLSTTLSANTTYEAEIDWNVTDNIGVTIYDFDADTELGTLGDPDDTYQSGYVGFKSNDSNGSKKFDWYTTSSVSANVQAVGGGIDGNVGANSVINMPSPPPGVDSTTNLYSIGDDTQVDRNNDPFVTGRDEESDSALRERAEDAISGGGAATHDAIVSALVNDVADVSSVTLYENKTDKDNTGSGGLPPHSFEAVVFGGTDQEVAENIFEHKAVTARSYARDNNNKTKKNITVTADSNSQKRDIQFSRPGDTDIDMTLDIAVDDTYIGDKDLRDKIVNYIGGVLSNGVEVEGLGVGENVKIDILRDIVVGSDTGVLGFDETVDANPIETTPSVTTVNGLNVIDINDTSVAQTDATDSSITLNVREI